ncbi:MAG: gliding motility-associated C-terminal domain-containing protein [Bacteroidetes bacterium]|nr:gliding motility-associated C-terminal domain-containing protein [Bacteroidota bacterium]
MKKSLSIIFLIFSLSVFATHNRAGEILYKRIAPFTQVVGGVTVSVYKYEITVIKYTDHSDANHQVADLCEDSVFFGDGQVGIANRTNGGAALCNDCPQCGSLLINQSNYKVKINIYKIEHTYPSSGTYRIRSREPNRNAGVINIPNSSSQYFYLESYLVVNDFTGANSSPQFENYPIDRACLDKCFYHNPGAVDPDGDLVTYHMSYSRGQDGNIVPGYSLPNPGPNGVYKIDSISGLLTWCSPYQIQGEYNLAFIVKEWRKNTSGNYVFVGSVLRDMQVVVGVCPNNDPPFVNVPIDTCVEAGALITKNIIYGDHNQISTITLLGNSGAFAGASPLATLSNTTFVNSIQTNTSAIFSWQTACDHVRFQPYQTVFKAEDNGPGINLVSFTTYNIRVVPPAVQNVIATPQGSAINLSWSFSTCNPTKNPIIAYEVYRKNDCTLFTHDPCETGNPAGSGFSYIGQTPSTVNVFTDNNNGNGLTVGQDYSYLIIAVYKDGSKSYGSSQVCSKLKRDVPVLLNVDILSTSLTTGSVFVRWEKPLTNAGNLDTLSFPGPYQFILKYREGSSGPFNPVFNSTSPYFLNLATQFTHININTTISNVEYVVEFIAGTTTVGISQRGSSVFLNTIPGDRHIDLQWNALTPWNNYMYTIYRKSPSATVFNAIATTSLTNYNDTINIVNRATYCYKILSEGQYSDPSITKPLLNNSQEVCATAVDLTPPCTPTLSVIADCPTGMVEVSWTDVRPICSDDVINYILFYKATVGDIYSQVALFGANTTSFNYDGLELISGCYAVQAIDSSNNVSPLSPDFCIDNCPEFELPNIVTLNGDGVNDFYKAIKVRQIKEIDLVIFDRWGTLVYKTKDPYFKWDGTSLQSKQQVSEGTFFYICDVFEPRLKGTIKRSLKGYMQVVK